MKYGTVFYFQREGYLRDISLLLYKIPYQLVNVNLFCEFLAKFIKPSWPFPLSLKLHRKSAALFGLALYFYAASMELHYLLYHGKPQAEA